MEEPTKMSSKKLDMREICKYVREDQKELPCQDTRKILALLGALPIVVTPPYMPSLSVTQSSLLYCVVVYSVLSYDVICSAMTEKKLYDEGDPSDALRIRHLDNILAMSCHLLGVSFWIDVPELLTTLKRYADTQGQFRSATGKPLIYRRKKLERYSYIVTVTYLFLLYIVLYLITPPEVRFGVGTTIASFYGNILALCATYVWVGLAWAISDAAQDIKTSFYRQLPFLTPASVYEFRILWISMRRTLDSMGKFRCTAAIYSTSVMASVYFFYKTMVVVQSGDLVGAFGYILCVTFYVGQVALICTAGHGVEDKLKCMVGDVLSKISLNSYDIKVQREIVMLFLVENSRPASVNFNGYTTVNKNLILSFVSNISTYIIVLIQFNLAGQTFGL